MNYKVLFKAIVGLLLSIFITSGVIRLGQMVPDHALIVYVISWAIVVFIAYKGSKEFKRTDGESGLVIYENYIDLFKCLTILGVPYILIQLAANFGQYESGRILAGIFAIGMTIHIAYKSAEVNELRMLPVVLITKLSMSFIWVAAVIQTLSPSGKNAKARRDNRAMATMILLFLTPIINMLVLDDKGKELVQSRFKGRRFQGAKAVRNALK
ncbi:hypothetical protein [Vibrio rotiferianus]|uniref:hypothetical protein n=1 Tax=Vibrio rotiferianus TaxID=190895 RepID=UPI0015F6E395|nr:hypothetical protein [Vibrio rotiferianus]